MYQFSDVQNLYYETTESIFVGIRVGVRIANVKVFHFNSSKIFYTANENIIRYTWNLSRKFIKLRRLRRDEITFSSL